MIPIYARSQLEALICPADAIRSIELGFLAYSRGETIVPPVGQLLFENPPGECHLKYGYRSGDTSFTIKIAKGFPDNQRRGLPTSNGVFLVFSSQTGELLAILHDEGLLTDIRTAAAGAVAAKLLAPCHVEHIGIIGAGTQASLQLEYLKEVLPARKAIVWNRSRARAIEYRVDGFEIQVADSAAELVKRCRLIVTTTASRHWLIGPEVPLGTHITAVGADCDGKQELHPELFNRAAVCAVDSRSQCADFGDCSYALREGYIEVDKLVELGELIEGKRPGRQHNSEVTIADLTGVAIQDIQIAHLALSLLTRSQE